MAIESLPLQAGDWGPLNQHLLAIETAASVITAPLPTGVAATDTANLQTVITAANNAGGNVDISLAAGTYVVNAALGTLTVSNVNIYGHGDGVTKIDASAAPTSVVLLAVAGSLTTSVALTADSTVDATTLTVAGGAEASFATDNYVLIGSEDYYEQRTLIYGANTGQKIGEINRVLSTSAGTITLASPLQGGYTDLNSVAQLVYKTSKTAFVQKMLPVENITIDGIWFLGLPQGGAGGTSSTQLAISVQYGRNVRITNVRVSDFAYSGISLQSCWDSVVNAASIFRCWNTGTGYAVAFGDASQDCRMVNCYVDRCRHAFTTTSNSGTYGIVRRCVVSNCHHESSNSTGDAFDTHAGAEDISFIGNNVHGSTGLGFNIECASATLVGNTIYQAVNGGIQVHNETLAPTRYTISGNTVHRATGAGKNGISYTPPVTVGAELETRGVTITGNSVVSVTGVGIIVGSGSGTVKNVTITGNTVSKAASTTANLYALNGTNVTIAGNVVLGVPASGSGIRVAGTTCSVAGNVVEFPTVGTGSGILTVGGVNCTVQGNTVTNAGKGINLDNASSNCTVGGNNLLTCTAGTTPGTGTGHIFTGNVGDVKAQSSVTITSSPQTILNTGPRDFLLTISAGTVSLVEVSCDQSLFSTVGTATGTSVYVPVGGSARVTYSVNPTMRQVPVK